MLRILLSDQPAICHSKSIAQTTYTRHSVKVPNIASPLAFAVGQAEDLYMTPGATHHKATAGALRAASHLQPDSNLIATTAALIDRETGVRELLEILENIVSQAGDLIESRSPELVAQARQALRQYGDETPLQAE